ncbi:MAG: WecB/TagA/CpsF family glycosyltransferase [Cyclobacteriaceae bacterium]|jgi:N-acetylglucosaminyldiphosphoundecaprenol N-acetyl-beta-D-mannosaminyltransferase
MNNTRARVVSLDISLVEYPAALRQIIELATDRQQAYACFCNAHMTVEAWQSQEFQQQVNQATFAFADGVPLVLALRWLYGVRQQRVAGMDFMGDILEEAARQQLAVYYLGSTPAVLDRLVAATLARYPGLKIAGALSPPFRPLTLDDNSEIVEKINSSGAQIIFVGLGCPKQERWMSQVTHRVKGVLLGVGGAFEIHADMKKRAPRWMQNIGLEWLFRLSQDPARLIGRYTRTNALFAFLLLRQLFRMR